MADSAAPVRRSLLTLPASRHLKWVVLAIWLVVVAVIIGNNLPTKFDDAQSNESSSFLPGDAESTKALAASEEIQGDELLQLVIIYKRAEGKLSEQDLKRIETDREALNAELPPRVDPYRKPVPSRTGAPRC